MQGFVDAELIRDDSAWHVDQAYRGNTLHDLRQMQKQASSPHSHSTAILARQAGADGARSELSADVMQRFRRSLPLQ